MANEEQHQMVVKNTYPTGVQEYFCPTCGRHFLLQWPPDFKRIVLNEGDAQALHSGSTGGVVMGSAEVEKGQVPLDDLLLGGGHSISGDDSSLDPWQRWLDEHGA